MDKQEKIVCAAIRNWMGKSENIVLYVEYPDHLTESLYQVGDIGYEKGFVTNKNRFVDPVEAMKIAISAHQLIKMQEKIWDILSKLQNKENAQNETIEHQEIVMRFLDKELKPEDLY